MRVRYSISILLDIIRHLLYFSIQCFKLCLLYLDVLTPEQGTSTSYLQPVDEVRYVRMLILYT